MAATVVATIFLLVGSNASIGLETSEKTTNSESAPKTMYNYTRQFCKSMGENDYISCTNIGGNENTFCCKTPSW